MRFRIPIVWAFGVSVALGGPGSADAQVPSPAEQSLARIEARARLGEGLRLYDEGRYEDALAAFRAAHHTHPNGRLHFNIAQAERRLGRAPEAAEAFSRFLAEATDAPADLRADAATQLAKLEPGLGRIDIACPAHGAEVMVDGKVRGRTPLGHALYLAPGSHQVAVRAPTGGFVKAVAAAPGRHEIVAPRLAPTMVPPSFSAPHDAPAAPPARTSPARSRAWIWAVAGLAAAAAVSIAVASRAEDPQPLP